WFLEWKYDVILCNIYRVLYSFKQPRACKKHRKTHIFNRNKQNKPPALLFLGHFSALLHRL
ncbi:MAG TPA: hypothetical protein PK011_12120, partial [Marinagarivorans sp.]|nr:hypothetical protein [Marinagarivorans sp.]